MIKFLKKWICKIFHIKQCACPEEMDEHAEYYLKTPEPEIPVHVEKPEHCVIHSRFRKSCLLCQEIVK